MSPWADGATLPLNSCDSIWGYDRTLSGSHLELDHLYPHTFYVCILGGVQNTVTMALWGSNPLSALLFLSIFFFQRHSLLAIFFFNSKSNIVTFTLGSKPLEFLSFAAYFIMHPEKHVGNLEEVLHLKSMC